MTGNGIEETPPVEVAHTRHPANIPCVNAIHNHVAVLQANVQALREVTATIQSLDAPVGFEPIQRIRKLAEDERDSAGSLAEALGRVLATAG